MRGDFAEITRLVTLVAASNGPSPVVDMMRPVALYKFLARPSVSKSIYVSDTVIDPNYGMKMRHEYSKEKRPEQIVSAPARSFKRR